MEVADASPTVTPMVASLALVASVVARFSVDKIRNLRENKKPWRIFRGGPKKFLWFHQIFASHVGRIVVSTIPKGVVIIAKGYQVAIIANGVTIIAPLLQVACNGLNQQSISFSIV